MLRLPYVPQGEAGEIIKKFVNDRQISIIEEVFVEHLVCGEKRGESPKSRDDYVAMLDEGAAVAASEYFPGKVS